MQITLPSIGRKLAKYELTHTAARELVCSPGALKTRLIFSAAHVVADPLDDKSSPDSPALDWDATLAYRRHLWGLGLYVAEAMDTAQRGQGLDWATAKELMRRTLADAKAASVKVACGAGTDQLADSTATLETVRIAYEEQCEFVEQHGGQIILMASRALASCARNAEDYRALYSDILRQVANPVILHWLGEPFDPALAGYWGSRDTGAAMETCLSIIREHQAKIDGIKLSLLDKDYEVAMRRRLPAGVRMYTGNDFHYDELIAGDEHSYSDALLGAFDPLAEFGAQAVRALDAGDRSSFRSTLAKTVPLSRYLFSKPTFFYKTGVVFLAYLNGHQNHFRMVGGQEGCRSVVHLAELFRLADQIGLFTDPGRSLRRMQLVLSLSGIEQSR